MVIAAAPEPEFFISLFFVGIIFLILEAAGAGIVLFSRKCESKVLAVIGYTIVAIGFIIILPFLILLAAWIVHWVLN